MLNHTYCSMKTLKRHSLLVDEAISLLESTRKNARMKIQMHGPCIEGT